MNPVNIAILGIPGRAVLWAATLAALALFGWRMGRYIRVLRHARRENRLDHPGRRLRMFVVNVLGQRRLLNERIGIAHFVFFWGFVFYAATFWWSLLLRLTGFLPIPDPEQIPLVATILDLFALAVLAGIAASVVRRVFFPPAHLHVSADAYVILGFIGMLMVTWLAGEGFAIIGHPAHRSGWTPGGVAVSHLLAGMSPDSAAAGATAMWWAHMLTVLAFLAYLPYSKHMHLLFAPFNVFFGNTRPPGDLAVAGEGEEHMSGAREWRQFTWRQLLNGFSCAECGRCDRACPCATGATNASPQNFIQAVKTHVMQSALKPNGASRDGDGAAPLIGGLVTSEQLWSCGTCMACMERCPVLNEHVPLIIQMRRALVSDGEVGPGVQDALTNLARYGNSFGKSPRMRARWTAGLDFKIKDARKEPVEALWFAGDFASFDPRLQPVMHMTARLLQRAGLDFGLLFDGESNAGNDVRRVGEEGLFQMLRRKNTEAIARARFQFIFTTDPHTYNTLKNEYVAQPGGDGTMGGNGRTASLPAESSDQAEGNGSTPQAPAPTRPHWRVLHWTELLDQLLREGRLTVVRPLAHLTVTYQDPCYLGRYNGIYDAPRRVLQALGVRLVEMPRRRNQAYCCGAGGGKIWMQDAPGSGERPAEVRLREAAALAGEGVSVFVTACPKDFIMFQDAVKTTGQEGRIEVKDLSEIVWDAVAAPAVKEA